MRSSKDDHTKELLHPVEAEEEEWDEESDIAWILMHAVLWSQFVMMLIMVSVII